MQAGTAKCGQGMASEIVAISEVMLECAVRRPVAAMREKCNGAPLLMCNDE